MKHLLKKARPTVEVDFMGDKVKIVKLSVTEVREFQKEIDTLKDKTEDADSGLAIQRKIIRLGVVGASELSDEELDSFPLDDLSTLAKVVLEQAGVRGNEGNA